MKIAHQGEQHLGSFDKELRVEFVGGHHRVKSKSLDSFRCRNLITLKQLVSGKAKFCFLRFPNDRIAFAKWTRVVAERNQLRQANVLVHVFQMAQVIQIDDRPQLTSFGIVFGQSVVGREHDVLARHANFFTQD